MGDGLYRSKDPTNSIKVLKEQIVHRQIKDTISGHKHRRLKFTGTYTTSTRRKVSKHCHELMCWRAANAVRLVIEDVSEQHSMKLTWRRAKTVASEPPRYKKLVTWCPNRKN